MKNAVGYIRASTNQQAEEDKFGIDVQKKEIENYATTNGYVITDWFIDEASGASDERPQLNELLYGNVQNPPVDAVIVFKNDRLARDTKLYFYYLYVLEKKGITLLSTKEEFQEGNEFTNIYRALLQFVAEQERRNIAIRTSKGRSLKASCGGYAGGRAPYGYKVDNGLLVINEEERPIVNYIFENYPNKVFATIAFELTSDLGYFTRKNSPFTYNQVRSILQNKKFYQGYYKYGDMQEWKKGIHEPILDEEGKPLK